MAITTKTTENLAPPGTLPKHYQEIANERSRINATHFHTFGLRRRARCDLGNFLRRLATHPERIPDGNCLGTPWALPIRELIDHIRLYTRDRKPYAAIFHPYRRLHSDTLKALVEWTTQVGLNVCVDADSEYYPGVTLRIVLYREGTEFPPTNIL